MGLQTWEYKNKHTTLKIKAKKDMAERIAFKIADLDKLSLYFKQINGRTDDEPNNRVSILFSPFGPHRPIRDPEAYSAKVAQFYAELPEVITTDNAGALLRQVGIMMDDHMPIEDARLTPEMVQEREKKTKENETRAAQKSAAFLAQFGRPDAEPLPRPDGQMAVVVSLCYDDSDMMTDYSSPHATYPYGQDLLLAYVPKQAQTERLARSILARYPELNQHVYTWHTENYSMGHGNYLQCGGIAEIPELTTYGGMSNPYYHYEIRFNSYARAVYPYKSYPGSAPVQTSAPAESGDVQNPLHGNLDGITWEVSHDRGWTWLKFSVKPPLAVLEVLKSDFAGRFSGKRQAWYFTRHIEADQLEEAINTA